jgi:DNA-binding protein YbaB
MNQMHDADPAASTSRTNADPWARLTARVDAPRAEADAAVARARQHADSAARLRAVGVYRGVSASVDAQGLLTSVTIDPRAAALPCEALAHAVQSAFRAALRDLVEKHRRCALQAWGDGATGRRIAAETAQRFGVPQPSPSTVPGDGA